MITLAPKHFVTKSINEKEKEISGPLVELTTAINKKKASKTFSRKKVLNLLPWPILSQKQEEKEQ